MLTDTHAHLDFPDFQNDLPALLQRAEAAGVSRIINVSTSVESSRTSVQLARAHPALRAAVGVHPCYVQDSPDDFLPHIQALLKHPEVVVLGETGLDYHRDGTPPENAHARKTWEHNRARQAAFFRQHLELAAEHGLNVIVHQRDSWDDTLSILRPYSGRLRAVFHCFGGTPEQAAQILNLGFFVSFTGIVTFKNATAVRETVAALPQGTFFLETDAPFLAPIPHRGKRCEPAHTRITAEYIAGLRNESLEGLAAHTTAAAEAFFRRRG